MKVCLCSGGIGQNPDQPAIGEPALPRRSNGDRVGSQQSWLVE